MILLIENRRRPDPQDVLPHIHDLPVFGWGDGYCFIPPDHPLHGTLYSDIDVQVHGGLTFSTKVEDDWILRHNLPPHLLGWWSFGFDTAHFADTPETWPFHRVFAEADKLYTRILALGQALAQTSP